MAEAAEHRVPPRPAAVDAKPIIGGRLWIPIILLAVMGVMANPRFNAWVSAQFAPQEPRTILADWKVGKEANVRVTLVTADANRLDCAHATAIEGFHCAFGGDERPWPAEPGNPIADNRPSVIQPYRTSPENHLILIAGLWADPAVAMRLHREPPDAVPVKRLNRFEAACRVRFIGELQDLKLRWESTGGWGREPRSMVARPVHCDIVQ